MMKNKYRIRRFLRFSTASLLLAITALSLWLGFVNNEAIRQRAAVTKLRAAQCSVWYDDGVDVENSAAPATEREPFFKSWLANLSGKDAVYRVIRVRLFVDATDSDLEILHDLPFIEELEVVAAMIQDEGLAHIGQLQRLRTLSLDSTGVISPQGFAELRHLTQLKSLAIENAIGDAGIESLHGLTQLRYLNVRGISDVGLAHLSSAFPKLSELHVRGFVSDDGLESLARLTDLEVLHLGGRGFTNDSLDVLSQLTKLRVLAIDNLNVSDEGLEHLSSLPSLTHLDLSGTSITGVGLHHVKQLPLISLDVRGGRLTPTGLDAVVEMPKLLHLKISGDYLHLNASVGPAGRAIQTQDLDRLLAKRPQLMIEQ